MKKLTKFENQLADEYFAECRRISNMFNVFDQDSSDDSSSYQYAEDDLYKVVALHLTHK